MYKCVHIVDCYGDLSIVERTFLSIIYILVYDYIIFRIERLSQSVVC